MPADVLRDRGLSSLVEGDIEILAQGLQFTEGPLFLADGRLIFEDLKAEQTLEVRPGQAAQVVRHATGAANGQTFDAQGGIIVCEQNGRRVSRMTDPAGPMQTVVETFEGKRLNSPNDIIARSDGRIYFTDPAYGVPSPEAKELPYQGVFTLSPDLQTLDLVLKDFEKPNGLALSPDEQTLYVCDTGKYHVRSFAMKGDAPDASTNRVFAVMDPGEPGGPDGMKVDRDGRVYVAVALGVWVYEPDGTLLGILSLPKRPSNLAWGGPDGRTLAITMVDTVCQVRMKVQGVVPPHSR